MATNINRVHFFITILCIAFVLSQGGATIDTPPFACFGPNGCPNDIKACFEFCKNRGIEEGYHCQEDQCCCGA
ncbi:hypothetical protein P8452_69435 [Trifolium repens]|nr:hypothetical protein P8452_69435 [Trifolium repens]